MDHPLGVKASEYFDTLFADDVGSGVSDELSIIDQIKAFD